MQITLMPAGAEEGPADEDARAADEPSFTIAPSVTPTELGLVVTGRF